MLPILADVPYPLNRVLEQGRFVCNYTYYHSLTSSTSRRCQEVGVSETALFLHCPPFAHVPRDQQLRFVHALLTNLAAELCQ